MPAAPIPDSGATFLAIEIGGTKLQVCAGRGDGHIADRRSSIIDRAGGAAAIRQRIGAVLPELIGLHQPAAIGVGYGGPVDWRSGRIWRSYHISGWSDFPLADWLRERSGLPAFVDNDGNVAALGETHRGAARGHSPAMYVTLGSGVGAGLTIDGEIYHGAPPGELELGHVRLDATGAVVQDRCSGWAVDAIVRESVKADASSILADVVRQNQPAGTARGEAKHLARAADRGCDVARRIIDDTARQLAFALSHAVHLLHPSIIVIGGGLSHLGELLRAPLAAKLADSLMDVFQPGPTIALSTLREDAVPVGALRLASMRLGQG